MVETTDTKTTCPACGEEILTTAKKCKHCGEWVGNQSNPTPEDSDSKETKAEEKPTSIGDRIGNAAIFSGISVALFYFGSWYLAVGYEFNNLAIRLAKPGMIFNDYCFVFRIGSKYYGFMRGVRFFDSPFIQWAMLTISAIVFGWAIQTLLTGKIESDD